MTSLLVINPSWLSGQDVFLQTYSYRE